MFDESTLTYSLMSTIEQVKDEEWDDFQELENIQTIEDAHYCTSDNGLVLDFEDGTRFMLIVKRVK